MSRSVNMFRDSAERHGRDRYSCPLPVWDLLRELGETFGWRPRGTTYMSPPKGTAETSVRHTYQPGDALDHKKVDADDAMEWAGALQVAKRSPHFAAMIEARSAALAPGIGAAGEPLPGVLDEFIEFAYGGAFTFAISDDQHPG